jgi:hypothetical protein
MPAVRVGLIGYALVELWCHPYRLGGDGWRFDIQRVGSWILESGTPVQLP